MKIQIQGKVQVLKCHKCGHNWARRKKKGLPDKCPNTHCHSPFWNKPSYRKGKSKKAV